MSSIADLVIDGKDNFGGLLQILNRETSILFSDKEFACPYQNPLIFNSMGKLPCPIYIKPGISFYYLVLDKDLRLISWGKFEANFPDYSMLRNYDGIH